MKHRDAHDAYEERFVIDLLTMLRRQKYSPRAWWLFLARSWRRSAQTAREHPDLKASWLRLSALVALLAAAILLATLFLQGASAMLQLLPGFLFCVAWQQSDLYWHLGLHRQLRTLGPANTLTWLRGLVACYLLGRLAAGMATPAGLALTALLVGVVLDILDGWVARLTRMQSKLGQIGDAETDASLYLAITLILLRSGALVPWAGILMLLRYCVPLLAALFSYFAYARPLRFGSTSWGRYAGLAQCLYFLLLLAPPLFAPLRLNAGPPLLAATLVLCIAAPGAQIVKNTRPLA